MALARGYSHMDDAERRLAQKLTEDGNTIARAAGILGRDHSTVRRNLEKAKAPAKRRAPGRPRAVTPQAFQKLMAALNFLLKQSKGQTEVTAKMVTRRAGSNLTVKTVRAAFHERGVWFRKLKEKPILTPQDAGSGFLHGAAIRCARAGVGGGGGNVGMERLRRARNKVSKHADVALVASVGSLTWFWDILLLALPLS